MDGKCYYSNYFFVFWRSKKEHNPVDYFRFFDAEDPVRNQNFVQK